MLSFAQLEEMRRKLGVGDDPRFLEARANIPEPSRTERPWVRSYVLVRKVEYSLRDAFCDLADVVMCDDILEVTFDRELLNVCCSDCLESYRDPGGCLRFWAWRCRNDGKIYF